MAGYRQPLEDAEFFRLSTESSYMPPENSHVVSRSTVRVIPQTGTEYSSQGNRVVRIVLPSTGFLDTQNSYFQFEFNNDSPSKEGVTGDAFPIGGAHTGIASLLQRVRILVGGSVVEDVNTYNLVANMLQRCGRASYPVGQEANLLTFAEGYSRGTETALYNKYRKSYYQFMHKPLNGVLNNLKYLPLAYIGEMTIELTLEDPQTLYHDTRTNATKPDNPTYSYSIRNFSYQCDILQFDQEYVQGFESSMLSRGINIPFETFTHYKSTVNSLGDVVINHRGRNVKNLWTFLRSSANMVGGGPSFRSDRCGLGSWQLRIGAFMKPLLPVRCGDALQVESFIEFLKTLTGFNRVDNGDIDINAGNWGTSEPSTNSFFAIGVDLEREGQIASGLDTASEATPITLSLTNDGAVTPPQGAVTHIDTFVHAGANLIISSPHEVTLFT